MAAAHTFSSWNNVVRQVSSSQGIETISNLQSDQPSLQSALQQLEAISELQKDWDSYGSDPPTPDAIFAVRTLIAAADRRFRSVPYFIGPVSGGGVQIEWRGPGREIEVEVQRNGKSFSYLLIEGKGTTNRKADEKDNLSPSQILDVIYSVIS
jgi:hypothetical protein